MIGRTRLDLTTKIGDIISTYLEEVGEDIVTVTDQVKHQHTVTVTIEHMLTEKILIPLYPDLEFAM